jgi:hypothetical protein
MPSRKKKKRTAFRRWSKHRRPGDAHTILSFCESNGISEALYYKLKREGKGPREARVAPKRIIITPEAEADWRREREADAATAAITTA